MMTIIICVCDYWHECYYFEISKSNKKNNALELHQLRTAKNPIRKPLCNKATTDCGLENGNENTTTHAAQQKRQKQRQPCLYANGDSCTRRSSKNNLRRLHQTIDAISAHYLLRELNQQTRYRCLLAEHMHQKAVQLLWLQLVPPAKDIIDYKFNHMLAHAIWERVEVEYLMSWLSTLGGGYSALGEHFERCAETAGKISMKQLAIGMRLGDPFIQARCRLYLSISLIQRGQLRAAKHIVREQYKFAMSCTAIDERLVKMCHGIWLRLRYEYSKRLQTADGLAKQN